MPTKKVSVFGMAKFQGIVGVVIGLFLGILYSVGGFLVDLLVTMSWASPEVWGTPSLSYGTVLAFGALLGMPLIFGIAGFILGGVSAVIFNLVSRWTGEINFR